MTKRKNATAGSTTRLGRAALASVPYDTFRNFSEAVLADGELPKKTKELIAVAHVTQCPDYIKSHTRCAATAGASPKEIMEAIWVAAEMRAGASYAHSRLAIAALADGTAS